MGDNAFVMMYDDQLGATNATAPCTEQRDAGLFSPQPWPNGASRRPIHAAVGIWITYLLVLITADYAAARINTNLSLLPVPYYISQLLIALFVLAISMPSWVSARLGRAFLPFLLLSMATLPMIVTAATVPSSFPGPLTGVGGAIMLRTLPMQTVVVVLIAWQYRIRHILLFCLTTTLLFTLLHVRSPFQLLNVAALAVVQGMGLLVLGYCASLLMDKLRAQQAALEQANQQLRHYASTLEQLAISRERTRVARELHDTLAHTLSGVIVQLEATKAYREVDQTVSGAMLQTALDSARSGFQETRRALKSLRASPLAELGLRRALWGLAEQAVGTRVRLDCVIASDLPALTPDIEQCIYRVAQEAIANVVQHANATTLRVRLSHSHGQLQLVVQDDGYGFEQHRVASDEHFGLAGMGERATAFGGRLSVTSAPGEGTTVSLTF